MVWNESMISPGDQTALAARWETAKGIQWSSSKRHVQGKQNKTGTREYPGYVAAGSSSEKECADLSSYSQTQNPTPTVHGGTGGFWLFRQRSLQNTDQQTALQQQLRSTFHQQSTGCIKCSTCMHMHTPRSRTNTKGSPLDNFEEAQQVFLLLGRRRILCSLVLNSHLWETLT